MAPRKGTPPRLGALEQRVMDLVWDRGPLTVREANQALRGSKLAYTTVMTTLDRLYKKGLLARSKDGLAFVYQPAMTRDDHRRWIVESTVTSLLSESSDPVLSAFVDVAAEVDSKNLARLEELIAARRRRR